jgi:penicillin-insensitive murein endopeptidase
MNKFILLSFSGIILFSCQGQQSSTIESENEPVKDSQETQPDRVQLYFAEHNDSIESSSIGSVSRGKLENGSLIPFSGNNFIYFDTSSYLSGRAFTHSTVQKVILEGYKSLEDDGCKQTFSLMELSNEHGGKIFPHRTHQNGMSADFMMPLWANNQISYKYDSLGVGHYLMDFDDHGRVSGDDEVSINFDLVAQHILELEKSARTNGMKIQKVIINTDLKDELFDTEHGKKLKNSGIYIVRGLEPLINDLHDDHYHIDFSFL